MFTKGLVNIEYAAVIGFVLQSPLALMLDGNQQQFGNLGNFLVQWG